MAKINFYKLKSLNPGVIIISLNKDRIQNNFVTEE